MTWHIVTGEFPPQPGGVSDYTAAVAAGLARAGATVHVWCPGDGATRMTEGVHVHPVAGRWHGPDLARLDREISSFTTPRRLLVQWVPHAFDRRSLNVAFCRWVRRRARAGDRVELMVHEPFLGFGEGTWRQDAAAVIHRAMMTLLLRAASRVWVSVPAWTDLLRPWAFGRGLTFCWLPVPSTIPVSRDCDRVAEIRSRLVRSGEILVGHFGTYGSLVAGPLGTLAHDLLGKSHGIRVLLLGRGSKEFHAAAFGGTPLASRAIAAPDLSPESLSWHLQACDMVVQPYPDGVSTRRTTAMAALAHGVPMVTTVGRLSEPFWSTSPAVTVVPAGDASALAAAASELARDTDRRRRQGDHARALYDERFEVARTLDALITGHCPTWAGGAAAG